MISRFPRSKVEVRKLTCLKNKFIVALLIALSLLTVVGQVSALQTLFIERPDVLALIS